MSVANILDIVFSSIQQFALLIIIMGMITAFLAKLSFIVNCVVGFILTIMITYLVHTFVGDFAITAIIFFVGIGGSFVIAAIGHIVTLIEAFLIIGVGIWATLVSGSPSSIFSTSTLIITIIASAILTGMSAGIGSAILGSVMSSRKSSKKSYAYARTKHNSITKSASPRNNSISKTNISSVKMKSSKKSVLPKFIHRISDRKKQRVIENKRHSYKPKTKTLLEKTENLLIKTREVENKLKNLENALEEKKIDQNVFFDLKREFQNNLKELKSQLTINLQEISKEIESSSAENEKLERDKQAKLEARKELKARLLVKDVSKSEYKSKDNLKKAQISEIDTKLTLNNNRINEYTNLLKRAEKIS